MQTLLGVAGLVAALFGALFFTIAVTELATGGDGKTSFGVYVGLIVFLGLTTAAGVWLAWTRLWLAPGRAGYRPPRAPGNRWRASTTPRRGSPVRR